MKKILSKPSYIVLAVLLVLALILSGGIAAKYLLDPLEGRIAQDVSIGGLEVGGMTQWEARKAVEAAAQKTVLSVPLTVELPRHTLTITPEDAAIKLDVRRAVKDAYRVGRKGDAAGPELGLCQYLTYEEGYLRALMEGYAARYDTTLTQPSWTLRGQVPDLGTDVYQPDAVRQTVELTLGIPEEHLDVEAAFQAIVNSYDLGLAGLETLVLEVEPQKLPEEPDLQTIYDTTVLAPKNDSLDMYTYKMVHGSYGYHFDMTKAKELVSQGTYGQMISIPMEAFSPEIMGENVYFRDVLGDCETKHTTDENRNTNLRLVCQILDGMVIQPGEQFSYNMAVGERTEERGFKPATVYSGNRKSKDFGGGVCQGSTTFYNCLLEADMQIVERHGHGALVSYIPLGLDAAVNWATETDLIFINNWHFPVKIQAEVSDGYMKMKLLGTDEKDYYIEMEAKSYQEGDYYYASSHKCKYDKETGELISREREAFSSYVAKLEG